MPLDKTTSHRPGQSPTVLVGGADNNITHGNQNNGGITRLTEITHSGAARTLQSRTSAIVRDARISGAPHMQPVGTNFDRPGDAPEFTTTIEAVPVADFNVQTNYDNLSTQLECIYTKWNVDDYLNGDDVSALINGFHHNQNNTFSESDLFGINILYSKLLIEDAINSGLDNDFVKSLALSILYTDLKARNDEAAIQALLQHVANRKDQNLFIIETLSSSQRRTYYAHGTGRIITRHPTGARGKPLVAVNVNKGYRSDEGRGQYTFRFLEERPSIRKLRYPKWDAHAACSRLGGNGQAVGNCGVIAYKEALQLARAFQDTDFKNGFFKRVRDINPFSIIGSHKLKTQFKTLYGFGENNTVRVHDKLSSLLLQKLEDKATNNPTPKRLEDVARVRALTKIRFAQKLDRDAVTKGVERNRNRPFRTISPEIIKEVGLDSQALHLADVKTIIKVGHGVPKYLGLSGSDRTDARKVIASLQTLWLSDAGTIDEKINLTKQLVKISIGAVKGYNKKVELIEKLISLDAFQSVSSDITVKAKRVVQNAAVDALNRYHSSNKQAQFLHDPRIKNIVSDLIESGNVKDAQRILSRLVFHTIEAKGGPIEPIRQLFRRNREGARAVNERNIKTFVIELLNDNNFMAGLQRSLEKQRDDVPLNYWIALIGRFVSLKSDEFRDSAASQADPTAKAQIDAFKSEWGAVVLRAAEHKLKSDKIGDRQGAIDAIDIAIADFGASESDVRENAALLSVIKHALAQQSGTAFLNTLSLARRHSIAQTTLKCADPIPLADKLITEFRQSDSWGRAQITNAVRLLSHSGQSRFMKGLLAHPADFQNAHSREKNDIVYTLTQLLSVRTADAQTTVGDFIRVFSSDLKQDLFTQFEFLEQGNSKLYSNYLINITNLIELSQAANSALTPDVKNIIKFDDAQTRLLSQAVNQSIRYHSGKLLAVTVSLGRISQVVRKAIQDADQQRLGGALQKSFSVGSAWVQRQTTFALGLLRNNGKARFIKGVNSQPLALQKASNNVKKDVIVAVNSLLNVDDPDYTQVVIAFANTFENDLRREISQQIEYRENKSRDFDLNFFNLVSDVLLSKTDYFELAK